MSSSSARKTATAVYTLPPETIDLTTEQNRLRAWMERFVAHPSVDLPRPPATALEILSLSNKPTACMEDVASLLAREPLLAGQVLQLANSVLYGSSPCVTLKTALIRMGLGVVRNVVMEAAMRMTIIRAEGFEHTLESIRRHSSAVAWISRFVARHTAVEPENAFLVGLFHDVGLSLGLVGVCEYLRLERKRPTLSPESWLVVKTMQAHLGRVVLEAWGLPPSIVEFTQQHHAPSHARPASARAQGAVLILADRIATNAGWGVEPRVEESSESIPLTYVARRAEAETRDALAELSLTQEHLQTISADMARVLATLKTQFQTQPTS